ncbi:MAG: GIY-YIG nuclease family protein [Pseudomonadota bacterium]
MLHDIQPCVYIMASQRNRTLYIGITSDLTARIHQHREGAFEGFSKQYGTKTLVWFEPHESIEAAILREKRLKKWNREWKLRLIEEKNSDWHDLAEDLGFNPLSGSPSAQS